MGGTETALALIRTGRYLDALVAIDGPATDRSNDILRVQLLERVGQYQRCRALIERLKRTSLSAPDRAVCECLLGVMTWESTGDPEAAIAHVQKALGLLDPKNDLALLCWFQLRFLLMLSEQSGPSAVVGLVNQLRRQVLQLGDPLLSATFHIFMARTDAQRGLTRSAERHCRAGLGLLGADDNLWLRGLVASIRAANCIMTSDIESGLSHAKEALALSDSAGVAVMRGTCLSNLGHLYYLAGDFEAAIEHLKKGQAAFPSTGNRFNGENESIARVYLALGKTEDAREYFSRIAASVESSADWLLYANRHSRLGLTQLLLRDGRLKEATSGLDETERLATTAGDHLLAAHCLLLRADLLRLKKSSGLPQVLGILADQLPNHPPELFAQYERVVGAALISSGHIDAGRAHFERARRWYAGLHNVPGRIEVDRVQHEVETAARASAADTAPSTARQAANLLQNTAALMMQSGRPELLATSLVAILADTGAVLDATARSRGEDGSIEVLASHQSADATAPSATRTVSIGTARNRTVDLVVRVRDDVESTVVVNAALLLLGTARDLERARVEREEQLALWPIEELPIEGENAVVGGCLQQLLSLARKVARTNACVLITGESGTGKEILAKAVHGYSARADRPFVPFNCTAVPREMLESQLFGYRRGSFTGADRDNPGLIRAAKNGTLFLDEIGEMSLELQPKLLRFLESGEISPLGEEPLNVDVRIVAATNRNLEQLVQEGRFREDLYYRLNVLRLPIPPLRERRDEIPALVHHFVQKNAAEFSKGRVRVADETMEHLVLFGWPGNIRQLQNEIRRMIALVEVDGVLKPSSLSPEIRRASPRAMARPNGQAISIAPGDKLGATISRIEKEMIANALRAHHGRMEAAAKALGISRKGLYLKRQRLGL